jgi:hypothetical protein
MCFPVPGAENRIQVVGGPAHSRLPRGALVVGLQNCAFFPHCPQTRSVRGAENRAQFIRYPAHAHLPRCTVVVGLQNCAFFPDRPQMAQVLGAKDRILFPGWFSCSGLPRGTPIVGLQNCAFIAHGPQMPAAVQVDTIASEYLRLAIQRTMVRVLGNEHMRQQRWSGKSTFNRSRWCWRRQPPTVPIDSSDSQACDGRVQAACRRHTGSSACAGDG